MNDGNVHLYFRMTKKKLLSQSRPLFIIIHFERWDFPMEINHGGTPFKRYGDDLAP